MASKNRANSKLPSFAGFLSRLGKLDNLPDYTSSSRLSSSPVDLLSFDELLSQGNTVAASPNHSQGLQGNNNNCVALPTSCRWRTPQPPRRNIMAHWRNDTTCALPANPTSLKTEDFSESSMRSTATSVDDTNNTNRDIASATEREIYAFLDSLKDIDPFTDTDMGGSLVYGRRHRAARSASISIKSENSTILIDSDPDDVDMDEETILDFITVSSHMASHAPGQDGDVPAEIAKADNSSDNSFVASSSSSEPQAEDQPSRQGSKGYRGRRARLPSSEEEFLAGQSSGAETEVREDDQEPPAPMPATKPHEQTEEKEEQERKYYYFATGLHMSRKKMREEVPAAAYLCPAKLKGWRWLICGPRRFDLNYVATSKDPFNDSRDPEGYATIAPVYKDVVYDRAGRTLHHSDELDLEGSCVYGSLYELDREAARVVEAGSLRWECKPTMVNILPLEKDRASMEPELAGSMPLLLREMPGLGGAPITVEACTYRVDGKRWHLPWRQPDINCGGHMEVGRLRDHERAAMLPYMRAYNMDCPPVNTPYPLPQFALDRRYEVPRPLSNDHQPQVYRTPYMDELRDIFFDMLFDGVTPLWYVNEVLRPWVRGLAEWPHPHSKRDEVVDDSSSLYD